MFFLECSMVPQQKNIIMIDQHWFLTQKNPERAKFDVFLYFLVNYTTLKHDSLILINLDANFGFY